MPALPLAGRCPAPSLFPPGGPSVYARRRIDATTPIALSYKLALSAAAQRARVTGLSGIYDVQAALGRGPWKTAMQCESRRAGGYFGTDWIARGAGASAAALVYSVGDDRRQVGAAGRPAEGEYMHRGSVGRRAFERLGRCRSQVCGWTYYGSEDSSGWTTS
ncbi:hypothetical protein TRAPUB_3163 [Trametes pubescens]|uniref:Uncharacterized protein n=1 Tax=Trametes pubescens TaxID=154538 RepID=A0A1M2VEJ8_TRAPU|nr:hypothetical protein TRAPUB_3163 [Trametes pubescens]